MVYTKASFLQNIARQTLGKNVAVHRPPLKLTNMTNWIQQQQAQSNLSTSSSKQNLPEHYYISEEDYLSLERGFPISVRDPPLSDPKQTLSTQNHSKYLDINGIPHPSLLPSSLPTVCEPMTPEELANNPQELSSATSPLSLETPSALTSPSIDQSYPPSLESSLASLPPSSFSSPANFISFLQRLSHSNLSIHTFELYKIACDSPGVLNLDAFNTLLECMTNNDYYINSSKNMQKLIKVYVDMLNHFIVPDAKTFETVITALCRRAKVIDDRVNFLVSRTAFAQPHIVKDLQTELSDLRSEMPLQTAVFMYTSSLINHNIPYSNSFYASFIDSIARYGTSSQLKSLLESIPFQSIQADSHPNLLPALIRAYGKAKRLEVCFQLLQNYMLSDPTSNLDSTNVESWEALMESYFETNHPAEAIKLMESFFKNTKHEQTIPCSVVNCFLRRLSLLGSYKEAAIWLDLALDKINSYKEDSAIISSILEAACKVKDVNFAVRFVRKFTLARFMEEHKVLLQYLQLLVETNNIDILRLHVYPVINSVSIYTNCNFSTVYKAFVDNGYVGLALRLLKKHVEPRVSTSSNIPSINTAALQLSILNGFWDILPKSLHNDSNVLFHLLSILESQVNFPQVDFVAPLLHTLVQSIVKSTINLNSFSPRVFGFLLEYAAFNVVQTEGSVSSKRDLKELLQVFSSKEYPASFKNVHILLRSFSYLREDEYLVELVRDNIVSEAVIGFSTDNKGQKMLADISQVCYFFDHFQLIDHEVNSSVSKMVSSTSAEQIDANLLFFQFGKLIENNKFLHPEVYPSLVSALSKHKQFDAVRRVFEHAKLFYRKIRASSVEKANWFMALVLDSMVLSSSFARDFRGSTMFCEQMKSIGYIPRASTFAHLINNSTKRGDTDDATTALKIFEETKRHNVKPSVFLYNAVLSKLGRARRTTECWKLFQEMKEFGLLPTSVTYGTVINAACRIGDEALAEKLFCEMENQSNYQPRVAPYNTMIQFEVQTMYNREKALYYYNRLCSTDIQPSPHTYKLLMDAYGMLEPVDVTSVEAILELMERTNVKVLPMHYAAYIHILGIVMSDVQAANQCYLVALAKHEAGEIRLDANLFQSQIESLIANDRIMERVQIVCDMKKYGVSLNAYIVNALIKGFTKIGMISKARYYFDLLEYDGMSGKEPSTYENMVRAYLSVNNTEEAVQIVEQLKRKRYPAPVVNRISSLVNNYMMQKPKKRTNHYKSSLYPALSDRNLTTCSQMA
ncbi:PPR repeat protein [Schizosaccharomyces cryophilus OY26]|uniref:PPR repeat protein n=1 Tax=Schizosaccharomyces cryophilus (strain OY26 / ATCC MYA-4695 / CBS 11777 / NBRC 106824 / NRRL Y48691) TaxID=653667 RepID=S9VR52_SCHCR|nr:PPR repeat protein [Schizosaccharomyces cryophilus OY26]EPY50413.1 PPR repeat protein [Schizosaccharomyces cryophilus OY26]